MTEEEKKELEHLNKRYDFMSKNPLATNVCTTYDTHCLGTVLNLISKQQKEIEKKDKVIDLMAEKTANEKINRKERWCKCIKENVECKDEWICKKCLKEYFYKQVEE